MGPGQGIDHVEGHGALEERNIGDAGPGGIRSRTGGLTNQSCPSESDVRLKATVEFPPSPAWTGELFRRYRASRIGRSARWSPRSSGLGRYEPDLNNGPARMLTGCVPVLQITLLTQAEIAGLDAGTA